MKSKRHTKILDIISAKEIETQEELVAELEKEGFRVTQATVSRDIKDLRLTKIPDERGGYKYATVERIHTGITPQMSRLFVNTVLSVKAAGNIIVIKTLAGSAGSIGVVVDSLNHPDVLGSVAGDDTMFVVVSSPEKTADVIEQLSDITNFQ